MTFPAESVSGALPTQEAMALERCADEPIAFPGAVQPHGALLALAESDLSVVCVSANIETVLDGQTAAGVLGRPLEDLLPELAAAIRAALAAPDLAAANPLTLQLPAADGARPYDFVVHRADGLVLVEAEPGESVEMQAAQPWHRELPPMLQRLQGAADLEGLVDVLAQDVRSLTGFDRVMVYRFDREWNGEVVAESRRDDLEPFLGLRYPASDIPAQARALYARHWLRSIPNVAYSPVPLEPPVLPATGRPLDLGGAALRSVSPFHIEYLTNMGVAASMSVSLLHGDKLWGLVACHHYSGPHYPGYRTRVAAEFLGRTASVLLESKLGLGELERQAAGRSAHATLVAALAASPGAPLDALTSHETTLLDLVAAAGAAVRLGGRVRTIGAAPTARQLALLTGVIWPAGSDRTPLLTESISRLEPALTELSDVASGVLAVPLRTGTAGDYVMWFRPEQLQEVRWGGNPHDSKVQVDEQGPRLSPRRSFAQWTELVRATAAPWQPHEPQLAAQLGQHVTESMVRRIEQDNRLAAALQRTVLLEQLPNLPQLAMAVRYLPDSREAVGGDWYDVVPLSSGRIGLVLGDVAGHGLSASAVTAQLRHALRAYLLREETPSGALARLNELVAALLEGELATASVAVFDTDSGTLQLASAGHLPPLHVQQAEASYFWPPRGPALGLVERYTFREGELTLNVDDRLVLFSDGLIERRDTSIDDRLEALRRYVVSERQSPEGPQGIEELCEELLSFSTLHNGREIQDDVTVLAVQRR